jgi:endonuclease/exonuclease/phosphatase family metal-dependent hydrolase
MTHRPIAPVLLLWFLLIVGCNESSPVGLSRASLSYGELVNEESPSGVTALTWNVYVGAEIERILQAQTPQQAVAIATEQWANVRATNFPARAGVLAAAIAARRPHLVGLEELALYRTTDRPFEELATHVVYDFLQLVIDSLRARGLDYAAAAMDRTTDIQVPVIAGFDASGQPIFVGVRFTDGDAVLVRGDVAHANPQSGVYAAHVPVTLGGVTSGVYQGWSSVEATVGGRTYRFVATHLAGQDVRDVQLAQTAELLALLGSESRPTILVGDFNSDAYGADPTRATPTYGMLRAAGYADSWIEPDRQAPGLTCCEQADLLNPRPTFDQRIDFIFDRNLVDGALPIRREVVGDRRGDRTAAGLWPSDHAGVAATFHARETSGEAVATRN